MKLKENSLKIQDLPVLHPDLQKIIDADDILFMSVEPMPDSPFKVHKGGEVFLITTIAQDGKILYMLIIEPTISERYIDGIAPPQPTVYCQYLFRFDQSQIKLLGKSE